MSTFGKAILYGLLALVIAVFALNRRIQEGRILPALAPLLQFCMPVDDLYAPVMCEPIDVSGDTKTFEYTFTNRYVGAHAFGVLAQGLSQNVAEATIPKFALSVEFVVDGYQVLSAEVEDPAYNFWTRYGDGYAYVCYDVPFEVPVGKAVHCRVKVTRADPEFQARHRPVTVYAGRE
ncbi:MAG: hypothetical protein V1929_00065 [bacterium]